MTESGRKIRNDLGLYYCRNGVPATENTSGSLSSSLSFYRFYYKLTSFAEINSSSKRSRGSLNNFCPWLETLLTARRKTKVSHGTLKNTRILFSIDVFSENVHCLFFHHRYSPVVVLLHKLDVLLYGYIISAVLRVA